MPGLVHFFRKYDWLLLALAVFCAGYLHLLLMWWSGYGDRGANRPGFFDYVSGTWGDGVCLPLMAGALVWINGRLSFRGSRDNRIAGALLGAAVAALVIIGWYSDPDPVLNWTMPAPHEFNAPGAAHAAFVLVACSFFGLLWTDFLHRLRGTFSTSEDEGRDILRSAPFAIAIGTAVTFTWLVSLDNKATWTTAASQSSIFSLFTIVGILVVALAWSAGEHLRHAVAALFVAIILAFAIGSLALYLTPDISFIAFVFAAGAFGFAVGMTSVIVTEGSVRPHLTQERGSPGLELVAFPALYLLVPLHASLTKNESLDELHRVLAWFVGVFIAVLWFRRWRRGAIGTRRDVRWLFMSTLFVMVTSGALTFSGMGAIDDAGVTVSLAFAASAAILAGPAIRLCDTDVQALIQLQASPQYQPTQGITSADLPVVFPILARLGVCLLGAGASVFGLTLLTGQAVGWNRGEEPLSLSSVEVTCALVSMAGSSILIIRAYLARNRPEFASRRASQVAISCGIFITSLALVLMPVLGGAAIDGWAAFQSLGIALFAGQCIFGNGLRLGLSKPLATSSINIVIATCGVWALVYWSLTRAVGTTSEPIVLVHSFIATLCCVVIVGCLVIAVTSNVYGSAGTVGRSFKMRTGNAAQDLVMMSVMWLLMVWLLRTTYVHIPEQPIAPLKWIMVGMVFAGFLSLYITALLWLIRTNDGHVGRRMERWNLYPIDEHYLPEVTHWKRLESIPERLRGLFHDDGVGSYERRFVRALGAHTAAQNLISLMVVASTIAGALWLAVTDWEV